MSRRTETAYKAEPQGESAQHDEAHPDLWGMVNAAVVQGKIMFLPGEIFNPTFSDNSFGYMPHRSVQQAARRAQSFYLQGYTVQIDIDLEKFF